MIIKNKPKFNTKKADKNTTPHNTKEDMRDFFFIVKGRYNAKDGIKSHDPSREETEEWYMVMDNIVFNTIACGHELEKCVRAVETTIKKHKTKEDYFKTLDKYTTEDYYRVHYLGERPYTHKELNDMMGKGVRTRTSLISKELYKKVFDKYGDHYAELIGEAEDKAYSSNVFMTPEEKASKRIRKLKDFKKNLPKSEVRNTTHNTRKPQVFKSSKATPKTLKKKAFKKPCIAR